jgi:site-specific recombinase XerD
MPDGKGVPLDELVSTFLFSLEAEAKSARTLEYYRKLLQHFLRYASQRSWTDTRHLDPRAAREFLAWIASRTYEHPGGNGARVKRQGTATAAWPYYRALRRLCNWSVNEGLMEASPLARVRFKPPRAPDIEPFSKEEMHRLLAVCDLDIRTGARFTGLRNKAMLMLFLDTAFRRSEMANLKMRDLNLEIRRVRVMGKGNKPGMGAFCARTAVALRLYLIERQRRGRTDAVWITEEGRGFTAPGLDSWFDRLKKRAGVASKGGVHKLRHTAALAYLREAKDSFLLQLFLRHESLEMSRRYTRGLKAEEAIAAHENGASPVRSLLG